MRTLSLVTAVAFALSSGGCGGTMSKQSRAGLIVGGAGLAVLGGFVARPIPVDGDGNGVNDTVLDDDLRGVLPGTALMIAGLALISAGATAHSPADERPAMVAPPVTLAPPSGPTRVALPEVATSEPALRMAKQVRSAVARGECDAAWSTVVQIQAIDLRYGNALADGAVMAPCRAAPGFRPAGS